MSAVAPVESSSVSVAVPVLEAVGAAARSTQEIEAAEQKRWMIWFGLPALVAAIFVGAVFGTGQEWFIGAAIVAIVVDIFILVWLAMTSDTNGLIGEISH